jgi:hypothetical protein
MPLCRSSKTRAAVLDRWRTETRFYAYGIIAATKLQAVENRALSLALGMDPRGLRTIMERDPHFLCKIDPTGRRGLWYAINPEHAPLQLPGHLEPSTVLITTCNRSQVARIEEADEIAGEEK